LAPALRHLLPSPEDQTVSYFPEGVVPRFSVADGEVFFDGSCFGAAIRWLARAGWGVVQVDVEGNVTKAAFGNVPVGIPQMSATGEFCGLSAAIDLGLGPVSAEPGVCPNLVGDYLAAVRSCNLLPSEAAAHGAVGAFAWKGIQEHHPLHQQISFDAAHTKAHRSLAQVSDDPLAIRRYHGNAAADLFAKKGAGLHAIPQHLVTLVESQFSKIVAVGLHIGRVLALWPVPKVPKKKPIARKKKPKCPVLRHVPVWNGVQWRCEVCLVSSSTVIDGACSGCSALLQRLSSCSHGHDIWTSSSQSSLLFVICRRCGAIAESSKFVGLAKPCLPPTRAGSQAVVRCFDKGRHPHPSKSAEPIVKPIKFVPCASLPVIEPGEVQVGPAPFLASAPGAIGVDVGVPDSSGFDPFGEFCDLPWQDDFDQDLELFDL